MGERWLGSLEPLLLAEEVATLVHMPAKWVYAKKKFLPGFLRLGRYIRFLPSAIRVTLEGTEPTRH